MKIVNGVPEIFIIADNYAKEQGWDKEVRLPPRKKPMPTIDHNPNIRGPLSDAIDKLEEKIKIEKKEKIEQAKVNAKTAREEAENRLIFLQGKMCSLQSKLNGFDINNKKDVKKITSVNLQMKIIEREMDTLSNQHNIKLSSFNTGSKFGKLLSKLKQKFRKGLKKIKKFFSKNSKSLIALVSSVVPLIMAIFCKQKPASV